MNDTAANQAKLLLQQGRALHKQGQLAQARALYEQVLAQQPTSFDALNLMGVLAAQKGDLERAAEWMGKALEINPNQATLHFNRGAVLQQLQRTDEALASFERALSIAPGFAEAHFHRGLVLRNLHRLDDALVSFQRSTAIQPDVPDTHFHAGLALHELGRNGEALTSFDHAIAIQPDYAEAHFNRGVVLHELHRTADALPSYDRAIAIKPDYAIAHCNRAIALHRLGRSEEALSSFDRSVAIDPDYAGAYANRGVALDELKRNQEALASYERAIALAPRNAEFHYQRGVAAMTIDPKYAQPHWNKSLLLLKMGRFDEGWQLHEWRWKLKDMEPQRAFGPARPLWLGDQPLAGKTILLHAEQGLGDTIQFCRYAKLVKALGATVMLEVPKALTTLLSSLEGVDLVIEQGSALPAFDHHCPLLSLPLAFKTRLETIPSSTKYLHAQPAKVTQWQQRLGPAQRPRVGLVWSGGFRPDQPELWALNGRRNLPLNQLKALEGLDVDFISLQKGEPAESEFVAALQAGWDGPAIANYSDQLQDFSDTAALIENLDLVVSVDTSVAHLAAALGKPVWILNRFDSCWRWLQDRTDSPWYPTVTLYNQRSAGVWAEVLQRVRRDMGQLAPSPAAQDVTTLLGQAHALHQQGRLTEAKVLYQGVLAQKPSNFDALNLLGVIAASEGDYETAVQLMGKAVAISPQQPMLHFNLGMALRSLKRFEEAVASLGRTVADIPNFAPAHFGLGLCQQALGRNGEALTSFQRAIASKPDFAAAHFHHGNVLSEIKRTQEAMASYTRAISLQPNDANALFNCANTLKDLQRFEEAVDHYNRAIAIQPNFADAYCNRGLALHELHRYKEAVDSFDRALEVNPEDAEACFNRGISVAALGHIQDAVASYDRAVAIQPSFAEPYWNKSLLLLVQADFEQGWPLYEWRWKTRRQSKHGGHSSTHPLWLGDQPLAGKTILLHAEQGLGDTIQFCRYAKLVKALGATVLLEVPKALTTLLASLEGVDRVIAQGSALPAFDYRCPLMSLPLAFETRLETIPSSTKYLHAQPAKVTQWRQRLGVSNRPRVGLVWSGGFRPNQPELWAVNNRRNLPLDQLKALAGLNVDFISLQKGEPAESEFVAAMQAGWDGPPIANYADQLQDFSDTAALIENLDLVVSVDTSVAHLAAALGKPVWILNRFDSCWRWLQDRTDSPWYPTVTLYNQRTAGDWAEVLTRVRGDLSAIAS